jgi:hypothetical protein
MYERPALTAPDGHDGWLFIEIINGNSLPFQSGETLVTPVPQARGQRSQSAVIAPDNPWCFIQFSWWHNQSIQLVMTAICQTAGNFSLLAVCSIDDKSLEQKDRITYGENIFKQVRDTYKTEKRTIRVDTFKFAWLK